MKIKLSILLLSLFMSCFSFGQIKFEDIKIDTSITGFHFAVNYEGTYVYTANGASDLETVNPSAFSYTIFPNATYQAAIDQLDGLLNMSTQNGYSFSDVIKKDTTIHGNKGYYISLTETEKETAYKNMVFYAFFIKDNTAILFVSGDLDNGKYIENFKKTFYSTKL